MLAKMQTGDGENVKFKAMQVLPVTVMGGKLGAIFSDLPSYIVYNAGFDIGCTIYVANDTNVPHDYALMAYLTNGSTLISEEALPVYGYTWFTVDPGDVATLKGALSFAQTGCSLTIALIEKVSGQPTDYMYVTLVVPSVSVPPPVLSTTPTTSTSTTSSSTWSSIFNSLLPVLMFGMLGIMITKGLSSQLKEK